MNFQQVLNEQLKTAMKAKDQVALKTIRDLKTRIKLREIAQGEPLTEPDFIRVVQTAAKQRKEAMTLYEQGQRPELVAVEQAELQILEQYLPQMMSAAEMQALVKQIIAKTGAQSLRDMGQVMGQLMQAAAGRADGKRLQELVREQLA